MVFPLAQWSPVFIAAKLCYTVDNEQPGKGHGMTPEEAYAAVGGNYGNILKRLGSEANVVKFSKMFLTDDSHKNLHSYLEEGNLDEAFRMAHTLKGSSQMLDLSNLYQSSCAITEALRHRELENLNELLEALDRDYAIVVDAFSAL